MSNNYESQIAYVENNLYNRSDTGHSITQITYINILTNIQLMCLITIRQINHIIQRIHIIIILVMFFFKKNMIPLTRMIHTI